MMKQGHQAKRLSPPPFWQVEENMSINHGEPVNVYIFTGLGFCLLFFHLSGNFQGFNRWRASEEMGTVVGEITNRFANIMRVKVPRTVLKLEASV